MTDAAQVTRQDQPSVERLWHSRPVRWSASAGVLLAVGFVAGLAGVPMPLVTGVYVVATVVGARFFAAEAVEELWEDREIGIELLMTVATVVAGLLGEWGEAASLAFLYSISEALEEFTEDRTRAAINKLLDLAPRRVTRLRDDGTEEEVDVDAIAAGDRFVVRPGQNVATDGAIEQGRTAIDESAVTGESVPVEKQPGDRVFAGTSNAQGALVVQATATASDNTLAKVVELVSDAQERKGRGEQFMQRFARIYSPAVLAAGALVALVGGIVSGDWGVWVLRSATVLVAAAPCALVISIPVTYVAAIGSASRKGVLIKGGIYLEELGRLRAVAMDKTGTLTRGAPEVVDVRPTGEHNRDDVLVRAAAVERRSEHPLARAVLATADDHQLAVPEATAFEAVTGGGARATLDGTVHRIGSPAFIEGEGHDVSAIRADIEDLEAQGRTVVVLADDHGVLGVLAIADTVRQQSARTVEDLHRLGIEHVVMLTGDNPRTARFIAEQVGIDEVGAALSPDDKAEYVQQLGGRFGHVAMVGDGINDAPPLATASVGIAMGTAGSDIAIETADVALMADDLGKLTDAIRIGRRTRRVVRQNLVLSFVILGVLVPGALLGLIGLPLAVLAHELSELVVIVNGTRLART
ncbi:heavy metal translocating P-type ATPase [Euzebya sp.]|uniref:heavy metal translocating P-type ATPase n=1 Tax=Euzebya sp. TaxID=1971409 RepID=UPI003517F2BA